MCPPMPLDKQKTCETEHVELLLEKEAALE